MKAIEFKKNIECNVIPGVIYAIEESCAETSDNNVHGRIMFQITTSDATSLLLRSMKECHSPHGRTCSCKVL